MEQEIEEILKHFGISHNELSKIEPFSEVPNTPNMRKACGIDYLMRNNENKKARIVIDYDADFPRMVIRVFSRDTQKEGEE